MIDVRSDSFIGCGRVGPSELAAEFELGIAVLFENGFRNFLP